MSDRRRIFPYERKTEPLLSPRDFFRRFVAHGGVALSIVAVALFGGTLGYRETENMPWIDAFLNASMILGGMGPVGELHTTAGKLFASFYALASGVVFLLVTGLLLGPLAHRALHRLHLDEDDDAPDGRD